MTDSIRTVSVVIRGRVQGVGYRLWTQDEARRLGLSGNVRNRADGSVEALFSGPADAVATVLEACRQGPSSARVTEVAVTECAGDAPDGAFAIR